MTSLASDGGEAARIRTRIAGLPEERASLESRLAELEADRPAAPDEVAVIGSTVTDRSPPGGEDRAVPRAVRRPRGRVPAALGARIAERPGRGAQAEGALCPGARRALCPKAK